MECYLWSTNFYSYQISLIFCLEFDCHIVDCLDIGCLDNYCLDTECLLTHWSSAEAFSLVILACPWLLSIALVAAFPAIAAYPAIIEYCRFERPCYATLSFVKPRKHFFQFVNLKVLHSMKLIFSYFSLHVLGISTIHRQ